MPVTCRSFFATVHISFRLTRRYKNQDQRTVFQPLILQGFKSQNLRVAFCH